MKTKLLLAFLAFSFISCSDDDTSPSQPEKNLDQMVVSRYEDGNYVSKLIYDFDDHNRLTQISSYNTENEFFHKKVYEYDQMLLVAEKAYYLDGSMDPNVPSFVTTFSYDGSLRINHLDRTSNLGIEGYQLSTSFIYNADNTISAEEIYTGLPSEDETTYFTYYKNGGGNITKKVDAEGTMLMQAVYEGDNVISATDLNLFGTTNYQFNIAQTPKGGYISIYTNRFDGNLNNALLSDGFLAVSNGVNKYVSQAAYSDGINVIYEYEFDEDGYPIKVSLFVEGNTQPYEVREITY